MHRPTAERPAASHPSSLYLMLLLQAGERFSFFGTVALLVLYFKKAYVDGGMGWDEQTALTVKGAFAMLTALGSLPGGWLGDRLISPKRMVLGGLFLSGSGHALLSVGRHPLVVGIGLLLLAAGTSAVSTNIVLLISGLYEKGAPQQYPAFAFFHMSGNVGALLSSFTSHLGEQTGGFRTGFLCSAIGVGLTILLLLLTWHRVPGSQPPAMLQLEARKHGTWAALAVLLPAGIALAASRGYYPGWLPQKGVLITNMIVLMLGIAFLGYLGVKKSRLSTAAEKSKMTAFFLALTPAFIFYLGFEQASGSMTFFAEQRTNLQIGGWALPASAIQNLNPLFVLCLAWLVRDTWLWLQQRYRSIEAPLQLAIANFLLGAGFLFMVGAAHAASVSASHKASLAWLVGAYLFHTLGELSLSPVALAFITRTAPAAIQGEVLGIFYVIIGFANYCANQLGGLSGQLGDGPVFLIGCLAPCLFSLCFLAILVSYPRPAQEEAA